MSNYFNKRLIELLKADIKRSKRLEKTSGQVTNLQKA